MALKCALSDAHSQRCCRSFGIFNISLWDDVFAEFGPLTEKDIIIVGVNVRLKVVWRYLS